jgi:hypothetical protein
MKEILKLMELFATYFGTKLNPHNFIREVLDNKYIAEIMKIIVNIDHKGIGLFFKLDNVQESKEFALLIAKFNKLNLKILQNVQNTKKISSS